MVIGERFSINDVRQVFGSVLDQDRDASVVRHRRLPKVSPSA
jgi:hypothetical protein